ncbi:Transmembrane protein 94 [Fragariocoptes setiger]|uniref:Transmembrane protein 94 n=1 Tax=Fragariocoptes setiger TaxID=1670756 RepID=A0ABQ7S6N5_9ACAR|nr:Transmembrane protein 94 [Fragariocoptes setiger]
MELMMRKTSETEAAATTAATTTATAAEAIANDGLDTQEALRRLHNAIKQEIVATKESCKGRGNLVWLKDSLSFRSELSKMRWPSVIFMGAEALVHFIVAFVIRADNNIAVTWTEWHGFILLMLLLFNLTVNMWDTRLRHQELLMKAERMLDLIYMCSRNRRLLRRWRQYSQQSAKPSHLFVPQSPCIHRQMTYRDGSCVNLPVYLLVKGDIIRMNPGDTAPGDCISVKKIVPHQSDTHRQQQQSDNRSTVYDHLLLKDNSIFMQPSDVIGNSKNESSSTKRTNNQGNHHQAFSSEHARLKRACRSQDFIMLSAPYINSLRISLRRTERPVNSVEKECFIVSRSYFETLVMPLVFLLSTIVTAIHYAYLDLTDSDHRIKPISLSYLLLRPALTIMPFLPWMFPSLWLIANAYGTVRLLCCRSAQRRRSSSKGNKKSVSSTMTPDVETPSHYTPDFAYHQHPGANKNHASFSVGNPPETDTTIDGGTNKYTGDYDIRQVTSSASFQQVLRLFIDLIRGTSGHVWRSSSLLQVLGSLTSLCCIDKVGILSWPTATPERICLLTNGPRNDDRVSQSTIMRPANSNNDNNIENNIDIDSNQEDFQTTNLVDTQSANQQLMPTTQQQNDDVYAHHTVDSNSDRLVHSYSAPNESTALMNGDQGANNHRQRHNIKPLVSSHVEVLDLTNSYSAAPHSNSDRTSTGGDTLVVGELQFDDAHWRAYLENLKPLGLSIMMNNCCEQSLADYFRFYKTINYESLCQGHKVPVVKRRCLCMVSRLIGFSESATANYEYCNQIALFRHIDPNVIRQASVASTLIASSTSATRLKLPFPNMTCNIFKDIFTGSYQVFSQGTADILLDTCEDYWDGQDLCPLNENARKKILDFYQRTSLTSYCLAFSYAPLLRRHNLGRNYIEFPAQETQRFDRSLRRLQTMARCNDQPIVNDPGTAVTRTHKLSATLERRHMSLSSIDDNRGTSTTDDQGCADADSGNTVPDVSKPTTETTKDEAKHTNDGLNNNAVATAGGKTKDVIKKRYKRKVSHKRRATRLSEALDELTDQVFVGMVAMQHQACPDFVSLVEQLELACIRFVHFSKENELRSRVFNEKMGLESGWNCHISLMSDTPTSTGTPATLLSPTADSQTVNTMSVWPNSTDSTELLSTERLNSDPNFSGANFQQNAHQHLLFNPRASDSSSTRSSNSTAIGCRNCSMPSHAMHDGSSLSHWMSVPSLVLGLSKSSADPSTRLDSMNCSYDDNDNDKHSMHQKHSKLSVRAVTLSGGDKVTATDYDKSGELSDSVPSEVDQTEPFAFDMSNRAKLPKGIENIRPHLEEVDNVPLQVSLFTDCTPNLTHEMIKIMQEYGEIVCVIGSSLSKVNTGLFLQANASIGIEPLEPTACMHSTAQGRGRQRRSKRRKTLSSSRSQDKKSFKRTSSTSPSSLTSIVSKTSLSSSTSSSLSSNSSSSSTASSSTTSSSSSSSSSDSEDSSSNRSSSSPDSASSSSSSSSLLNSSTSNRQHSDSSYDTDSCDSSDTTKRAMATTIKLLHSNRLAHELPNPTALASLLATLPCSFAFKRNDPVSLHGLIMEARHFTFKMKNSFVCMICFALSLSSAQFLTSILFLPPMLSSGLTIWLTVVVVPLMSFSLMGTEIDSQVMKIAVGKNLQLKKENIIFFVICYLIKFIPSIIIVVLCFGAIIAHSCDLTGFGSSSLGPCWMFTSVKNSTGASDTDEFLWSAHLLTAQVFAAFLLVLYFIVISAGFVHRTHLMWQRSPCQNRIWVALSIVLLTSQILFSIAELKLNMPSSDLPFEFLTSLPVHIWAISSLWPLLVLIINVLVKRAEIKATIRQQRRARFDFNTKLGMNSPF